VLVRGCVTLGKRSRRWWSRAGECSGVVTFVKRERPRGFVSLLSLLCVLCVHYVRYEGTGYKAPSNLLLELNFWGVQPVHLETLRSRIFL